MTILSLPQVRCGGSGQWFRPLRAMVGPAPLRWSSGNPAPSDPATGGSTAPGPSVGLRCVNKSDHYSLIQAFNLNACIDCCQQKCGFVRPLGQLKSIFTRAFVKSGFLKTEILTPGKNNGVLSIDEKPH